MKRFIAMFMLLLLVGMSFPAAMADEHETEDNDTEVEADVTADAETESEIEDMDTVSGAEMRLLQLQHQLTVKAEQARAVVAKIDANLTAEQTAELEAYAAQLDALAASAEDAVADVSGQTNQESVEVFLAIKAEGKDTIEAFREKVHTYVKEDDREKMRKEVQATKAKDSARLEVRIKEKREEHNSIRAKTMLTAMGVEDVEEFVAKIKSGEITADDIREAMKERFDNLSEEKREKASQRLREEHTKIKIATKATIDEKRGEIREKREEILREQISRIDNERARERLETRLRILESGGNFSEMGVRSETRTEIRERVNSDGTIERRERIREEIRVEDDGRVESETEIEVEEEDRSGSSNDEVRTESDNEIEVEVRT